MGAYNEFGKWDESLSNTAHVAQWQPGYSGGSSSSNSGGGGGGSTTSNNNSGGGGADYHVRAPNPNETYGSYVAALSAGGVPESVAAQVFGGAHPPNTVIYPSPGSGGGGGGGSSSGGGSSGQGYNHEAAELAAEVADNAATQAYNRAKLNLESEAEARAKAAQAWKETMERASLTGTFDGSPTFAREQHQDNTAQAYLQLLASLRGPANAFQYARTLAGTPGGLRDIVNAAAGRLNLAGYGGANTAQPTQRATLGGLLGDLNAAPGIPDYGELPLANQINAAAYNRMLPTQKDLLWGAYEFEGKDPLDVRAEFFNSLPKYGGPAVGATSLFRI